MSENLSTEPAPKSSRRSMVIAGIVLILLISLAFVAGFIMGRQDNPPPIIINTAAQ